MKQTYFRWVVRGFLLMQSCFWGWVGGEHCLEVKKWTGWTGRRVIGSRQFVVGVWSVFGRYVVVISSVCGRCWSVSCRCVVGMWSVCGRYLGSVWSVPGRYVYLAGMWLTVELTLYRLRVNSFLLVRNRVIGGIHHIFLHALQGVYRQPG